jgi:transcriptional regulator GlxA family with amidase domain
VPRDDRGRREGVYTRPARGASGDVLAKAFLAHYRLDRARELLESTDRPVKEVAAATGYGDPSHLRRREGLSPRAYRGAKGSPALP